MQKHVTVVGALHIGYGVWMIMWAIIIFLMVVGAGFISRDKTALAVLTGVGCLVPGFMLALSVPGVVGGIGVLRLKPWARYLVLIVSVLALFSFPFGTAIGIYSIWVLVQEQTAELFASASSQ